jgi:adenylate kinase
LEEEWGAPPDEITVIDGHLSHHLPIDAVIVLRCSPEALEDRLSTRGYSEAKTSENCEWELLGGAWNESRGDVPWVEFDSSVDSADQIVAALGNWMAGGFKTTSRDSVIDWVAVQEG